VFGRDGSPGGSTRRVNALIAGLPADSATHFADKPAWRQEHELLATLIEIQDSWGRLIVQSNAGKKFEFGAPLRITHPDRPAPSKQEKPKKGRLATPADITKERG
jgi:hypothetical protein